MVKSASKDIKNKQAKQQQKVFLVFNTIGLGDVLLCNSLCQNIKHAFPDSKIVFISNYENQDAAKYQEGVDDVIACDFNDYDIYDKNGEYKDISKIEKFVNNFKYKDVFAAIITYHSKAHYTVAKNLKCKHISMEDGNFIESKVQIQKVFNNLLSPITNVKIKNYPIKYHIPSNICNPIENILSHREEYITLCCISTRKEKNMPPDTTFDLIKLINSYNKKAVLVGKGDESLTYSKQLETSGADFINMVNKTSILELGQIVKNSQCLISIDTGTMHLGYALQVPTVCVIYEDTAIPKLFAPSKDLYNYTKVLRKPTAEDIVKEVFNLCDKVY